MFPCYFNRSLYDVKQACIDAGFELSKEFMFLSDKEIKQLWNGIGAGGKWYNWIIPKTAWGLNINLPSCPHDIDYALGVSRVDKVNADVRFRKNMVIWIRKHTKKKCLLCLRIRRIRKYYYAVKIGGDKAFFSK